ncbi:UDP-N-acetylmuramoylalanyl-D-glutamate--2,6-diaminopimelate ligase [Verrucomicrobium sp. GAS474]|uniref:UDP-N-acetylmuramoyl-L-alanyl-D-glutamate--2, 6-diaminopimelate ligase n=1 Tax=Verrucomicrobium sp. GAS474 TaxID=1882831 RepID=UPI00087A0F37|nr:UDP-N-acetylmuramoyl-L-alanyl-D-glutamate--2,6-diaminopimelate ligase [Verrucomicrobium sp. GAS474]SDU28856.1 UDP-N-acetylmuramoylalanyl-D-glutamate--2,6-diaminopimelate ligase [Verrucomicrobium sp. GAS474]
MKLADLIQALPQCELDGSVDREIRALRYDSRRVEPGDLFFAWRGAAQDGHRFIADACARGAAAVVLESETHEIATASFIRVPDARRALALMAGAYYGYPARELSLVGVTGTNGKTTTAFAVQHFLRLLHPGLPVGMLGTVRYDLGERIVSASRTTPEGSDLQEFLAEILRAGCRSAAMEVSSHALDQGRIEGINFDAAIFTNLTPDHLDYHQTMEAYFTAKRRLFERLTPGRGAAVINLDDPYGRRLFSTIGASEAIIGYSASGNGTANLRAENVRAGVASTGFDLVYGEKRQAVTMPLIGKFNVANVLGALGAAFALGFPFERSAEALLGIPPVPGRMERFGGESLPAVVVDYAHTEDAMRKALRTLRELGPRRLSVVIGCGGNRDKTKRPKMAAAAVEMADRVYFTADNPRNESVAAIFNDMKAGVPEGKPALWIDDRREAIARAIAEAEPGDLVCVAGKGHEAMQEVNGVYTPFDDRALVASLLEERSKQGRVL